MHPKPSMKCSTRLNIRTGRSTTRSHLSTTTSGEEVDSDGLLNQGGFTVEIWLPPTCTSKTSWPSSAGSSSSELHDSSHAGDIINVTDAQAASPTVPDRDPNQAVYQREMLKKDLGHPLWNPQPDVALHPSYRQTGISVGDVGIFHPSGAFDYLFNIFLDANHPSNPIELPEGFEPLNTNAGHRSTVPCHTAGYVASSSARPLGTSVRVSDAGLSPTKSFDFAFTTAEASVLILPDPCYREQLQNMRALQNYASHHGESWYRYANGPRGLHVENGQLQIVTECDKTTSWAILTHSKEDTSSTNDLDDRNVSLSWATDDVVRVQCRTSAAQRVSRSRNQCIFLRSSGIHLSDVEWERVRPPSQPPDDTANPFPDVRGLCHSMLGMFGRQPATNSERESTRLIPSQRRRPQTSVRHPSSIIATMLLKKHPEARVAFIQDDNWCAVIRDGEAQMPSDTELFRRVLETFDVVIDGSRAMYLSRKVPHNDGYGA